MIPFERFPPRTTTGWDKETGKYVDKSGVVVNDELIGALKSRWETDRGGMTMEEKELWSRWKNWSVEGDVERMVIPEEDQAESMGRGRRIKKPTRHYGPNARDAFLASEMAMVADASGDEPKTYTEAVRSRDGKEWSRAIMSELDSLKMRDTWRSVRLPEGRRAIGCKWVFKRKRNADGNVVKYKARLVAKGYSQQPGIDYEETYAPVSRATSLRLMLALAATHDLELHQADVDGAYLNTRVKEEIYMKVPEGLEIERGYILQLLGSLYGLKQSGRNWWEELGDGLTKLGFIRLHADWGMYIRPATKGKGTMIVLVYVDDLLFSARTKAEIKEVKSDTMGTGCERFPKT
jgi:hypothetical protein